MKNCQNGKETDACVKPALSSIQGDQTNGWQGVTGAEEELFVGEPGQLVSAYENDAWSTACISSGWLHLDCAEILL